MKLNKVLALALSGVMAVSMLAGCKGGSANGEQDDVVVTPTASNAVTIMNNMQSKVEFKADPTMDAAVASAVEGLLSADIKDAQATPQRINKTNNSVYEAVNDKLPGVYELSNNAISFSSNPTVKEDTTATNLYMVKAANLSEENVLTLIANTMNMNAYSDASNEIGSKYYAVDYTGAVTIVKASTTEENGTAHSAYIVAVSVTQAFGAEIEW